MWMLFLLGMMGNAQAGKLAEGFRGFPYGPKSVLEPPALPECSRIADDTVCDTMIGEAKVELSYATQENIYFGTMIVTQGAVNAQALLHVLQAAYGEGQYKNEWDKSYFADRIWQDGDVFASFEYNQFSGKAQFMAMNRNLYLQIETIRTERAKKAVNDL